ncbi:MAG: lytic transglycosylase domain-containing protein [Deltaproteobacteria bacterium]|nr:lytic transglycosylase domain-containing protein [Deltaproteobacteria bacterium]
MRTTTAGWLGVAILLLPRLGHAELYSFVDDEGVLHFTNIPDDPRYEPYRTEGTQNTFSWQDGLGTLRRVHRVDVTQFDAILIEAARYYSLPPALAKAVAAVESSFEPAAVSPAGAQGLMQLIPATARAMQVADPFDARQNVYGGSRYLRILANRFRGDVRLTVAAYNAGPDAVERAGGVPPFAETRTYVQRVLALYRHYLQTWGPGAK